MAKIQDKNELFKQYAELLPWEKQDFLSMILGDLGEANLESYMFHKCGYSPFDFISARDCVDHYGAYCLMDEMFDSDIEEYIDSDALSLSPYCFINALGAIWEYRRESGLSETNIRDIEKLLNSIKSYKAKKNASV